MSSSFAIFGFPPKEEILWRWRNPEKTDSKVKERAASVLGSLTIRYSTEKEDISSKTNAICSKVLPVLQQVLDSNNLDNASFAPSDSEDEGEDGGLIHIWMLTKKLVEQSLLLAEKGKVQKKSLR